MGEKEGFQRTMRSPNGTFTDGKNQLPVYKRRKCRICCCISVLIILAWVIVIVVLSQTLFKFKDPIITMNSVKLENIAVRFDLVTLAAVLNVTVDASVRVDNPNHYSFTYENSTMFVTYHGQQVGDIALDSGEIKARQAVDLNAVVTVEAIKIVENSNVLSDIQAGVAPLGLSATIPGRVNVANIYKHHAVTTINCNMDIFLGNGTLKDMACTRSVKL